ncbi:MAG: type II toxin-antitoxin system Phd/YefM family antitoxin [Deltaproteobacteria bacterium]|nr:type II toxin-antitoxin system Phd/YefM family antitoxin [Deltaproteobacteria bacterium]
MANMIGAAEFKASCLRVINQMSKDGEPVTITRRGRPVAVLHPIEPPDERPSIIGAMRGSVLAYHDPFRPAADPSDWSDAE